MPEQVKAVPPGFHTLTPHLVVRNAEQALEFYKNAFGAEVLHVAHMPDGKVMHASLRIGDSMLMLNDEFPDYGTQCCPEIQYPECNLYAFVKKE